MRRMATGVRRVVLVLLLVAGAALLLWSRDRTPAGAQPARFSWVATAHQLGVVGYRDPVGAISPDGRLMAYSEGRFVRLVPAGGGASVPVAPADGQVRHLAWRAGTSQDLIVEDTRGAVRWWIAAVSSGARTPLFGDRESIEAAATGDEPGPTVRPNDLRSIAASGDGAWLAGLASGREGPELWRIAADGTSASMRQLHGRVSTPAWMPDGEIACVIATDGRSRLSAPCGDRTVTMSPDLDVHGPLAFSPDGAMVYVAAPNDLGTVDLWAAGWSSGRARRLTSLDRDTYAPSVAADGTLAFKVQSYRTFVAEIELATGRATQLSTFQSETPSYDPTGRQIAVTYGTWRRLVDDANYPDIAQEIGTIPAGPVDAPASEPQAVIADSDSEDQAMTWSPNGRWIALHSHRELSDDIWLRPADASAPDRRITFLGRGAEVGWPRWSPDGRTVLFDGASPTTSRSVLFVIGVDQESGEVTTSMREIGVEGLDAEASHAEWLGDSRTIVGVARAGPGRHVIFTVPATGGPARVMHRFPSEHDLPGLGASPDGRAVAFVQLAPDGYYQIFRLPLDGGAAAQITFDPSHKTQPAWSPDGGRIAYTVWSYTAQFWTLR